MITEETDKQDLMIIEETTDMTGGIEKTTGEGQGQETGMIGEDDLDQETGGDKSEETKLKIFYNFVYMYITPYCIDK